MYKDNLWDDFLKTGKVEKYIEFKRVEELEKEGAKIDETNKSERNSNTRKHL
ncbi:MAG: hypothetical protein IKD74_00025 [Clostridia bacterium]|nr:hypothetical protein [Clostridia bacterium]